MEIGSKRSITNVLDHVLTSYKYASLAELNAVLKMQYYRRPRDRKLPHLSKRWASLSILNANGEKIGVSVKASLIYNKPALKKIETQSERDKAETTTTKVNDRNRFYFIKKTGSHYNNFHRRFKRKKFVVFRQNEDRLVYGVTYVDHRTKCVFNASHLGKQYSANRIQQGRNAQVPASTTQQIAVSKYLMEIHDAV